MAIGSSEGTPATEQQGRAAGVGREPATARRAVLVAEENVRWWRVDASHLPYGRRIAVPLSHQRQEGVSHDEAREHRGHVEAVLDVQQPKEALHPDLEVDRAAAILRALCRAEVYRELVEESGWSPDEYEAWLFETLAEQLLPSKAI